MNLTYYIHFAVGIAVSGSPYGVAGGSIVLQDVMCTGFESSLNTCFSIADLGNVDQECRNISRAAGVICMRSKYQTVIGHFDYIPALQRCILIL